MRKEPKLMKNMVHTKPLQETKKVPITDTDKIRFMSYQTVDTLRIILSKTFSALQVHTDRQLNKVRKTA